MGALLEQSRPSPGSRRIGLLVPLAHAAEALARLRGKEPFLTVDGLAMARNLMFFSSDKARRALGYRPGPHRAGVASALEWFGRAGYLH